MQALELRIQQANNLRQKGRVFENLRDYQPAYQHHSFELVSYFSNTETFGSALCKRKTA